MVIEGETIIGEAYGRDYGVNIAFKAHVIRATSLIGVLVAMRR
jgi:hypothetical protein